jgi:hypothetical protein
MASDTDALQFSDSFSATPPRVRFDFDVWDLVVGICNFDLKEFGDFAQPA